MSKAQSVLSSSDLFTQCGHALCGHGPDWKARFGQLLGNLKPDKVDAMCKGVSRIPPSLWGLIAVHLHDRGFLDLVALRDRALEASAAPLCRLYTVRNIEFSVEPSIDGRWPVLMISNKPYNQVSWWRPARDYEFRLPDDTTSARLEFDGERGNPFLLAGGGAIFYPPNMLRAKPGITPNPGELDMGELNERTEAAKRAWMNAQAVVTGRFSDVTRGGPNPTMEEVEDAKYLRRIYDELHSRRLAVAARLYADAPVRTQR
jgi:hypothetical protein